MADFGSNFWDAYYRRKNYEMQQQELALQKQRVGMEQSRLGIDQEAAARLAKTFAGTQDYGRQLLAQVTPSGDWTDAQIATYNKTGDAPYQPVTGDAAWTPEGIARNKQIADWYAAPAITQAEAAKAAALVNAKIANAGNWTDQQRITASGLNEFNPAVAGSEQQRQANTTSEVYKAAADAAANQSRALNADALLGQALTNYKLQPGELNKQYQLIDSGYGKQMWENMPQAGGMIYNPQTGVTQLSPLATPTERMINQTIGGMQDVTLPSGKTVKVPYTPSKYSVWSDTPATPAGKIPFRPYEFNLYSSMITNSPAYNDNLREGTGTTIRKPVTDVDLGTPTTGYKDIDEAAAKEMRQMHESQVGEYNAPINTEIDKRQKLISQISNMRPYEISGEHPAFLRASRIKSLQDEIKELKSKIKS